MTSTPITVTVATSTLGERIGGLRLPEPASGIDHLVIHQGCETSIARAARVSFDQAHGDRGDITVAELPGRGLSRSRNAALAAATGAWTHVCDDDVTVDLAALRCAVDTASARGWDVVTVAHRFADDKGTGRQPGSGPHTRRTIGSVSSYDIVVRNAAVRAADVRFDELFGLGAPWPSGEEAVFLADCLRAGLEVHRLPLLMSVHPAVHSGLDFFTTPDKVAAKREMLRRIFGRTSYPVAVLWWARKARIAGAAGHGGRFAAGMLMPRALLPASTGPQLWPGERRLVVSGVRSTTHVLYAASYVQRVLDTGARVTLTLLDTGTFLGAPRVQAADIPGLLPTDPRLRLELATERFDLGDAVARGATLVCVGAPSLRGVWAGLRAAHRLPEVVVVDEGIGSYGTWRTRRQAMLREGAGQVSGTVKAIARAGASWAFTTTRWSLFFQDTGGRWVTREAVALPFRQLVSGHAAPAGSAVILTQPWVDLGLVSDAAYEEHLAAVDAACAVAGLELWVRPHPSEPLARYIGRRVITGHGPVEIERAVVGARVVLGADSTALLNLAAVHGCNALRVGMPELDVLVANLGSRQASLLDAYLPGPVRTEALTEAIAAVLDGRGQPSW